MALRFTPTNVKDFGKNSVTTLYVNHAAILQVLGAICFSRVDIIYLLCIPSRLQKAQCLFKTISKLFIGCFFVNLSSQS